MRPENLEFYRMLIGNKLVVPDSLEQFTEWFKSENRIVRRSTVDDYMVSTVCLGIWHIGGWFETMVQQHNDWLDYQRRYLTLGKAQAGHEHVVTHLKIHGTIEGIN